MNSIPLSQYASGQLSTPFAWAVSIVAIVVYIICLCVIRQRVRTVLIGLVFVGAFVGAMFHNPSRTHHRNVVLRANAEDYARATTIQSAFQDIPDPTSLSPMAGEASDFGAGWTMAGVNRFYQSLLRFGFSGYGGGIFGGSFSGNGSGEIKQWLSDDSAVLLVTRGGETLRLILPSSHDAIAAMTNWFPTSDSICASAWSDDYDHLTIALRKLRSEMAKVQFQNAQMVDQLDLVSPKAPIRVYGISLQPGVGLCTALEFGGKTYHVLPLAYVERLCNVLKAAGLKTKPLSWKALVGAPR